MKSVSIIIILCSLPAGLGVTIDLLILNRHKGRLYNALFRYWEYLDKLSIPDIWRVFADYTLRFFKRVFGERFLSFRCIITIILVSFCLTICALLLGIFLSEKNELSEFYRAEAISVLALLLLVNLVFDTATGLVTVKVLSVIRHSTQRKAVVLIIIDIILAFFFAMACLITLPLLDDITSLSFTKVITLTQIYIIGFVEYLVTLSSSRFDITGFIYGSTTFIPTFIYLTILFTLIISKAILGIGIRVTTCVLHYFLDRATEPETSISTAVFTLTGSFFSAIVLFLTMFTELRKALQ